MNIIENEEKMASQLKKIDEEKSNLQNEINQLQEQVKLLKLAKQLEVTVYKTQKK